MLAAYVEVDGRLQRLPPDADLTTAIWVDLLRPTDAETTAVMATGRGCPHAGGYGRDRGVKPPLP